ncbi:hypothetical protein [Streptomyces microflavus]|uniref:hypothetical protein n=1 Tax=Streptomyces microflavus TaxID=1919 RepID=UPI0036EE2EE7
MDDLTRTRMWIDTVPSLDPDTREVILHLDRTSTDPAERLVHRLLDRGHEGEAGVFHLLPDDLAASYGRTGDRLTVTVSTHRDVLTRDLDAYGDELRPAVDGLLRAPHDGEHVVLLRRETVTDFVPAERDGQPQPALLIEHAGGPAGELRRRGAALLAAPGVPNPAGGDGVRGRAPGRPAPGVPRRIPCRVPLTSAATVGDGTARDRLLSAVTPLAERLGLDPAGFEVDEEGTGGVLSAEGEPFASGDAPRGAYLLLARIGADPLHPEGEATDFEDTGEDLL